jgi:hypothetical protein
VLTYPFAVLAACANATSSVLQRKADKRVPQGENLSLRLTGSLLHQPVWFFGVLVFREQVRTGWFLAAAVAGGLLIVGAVLMLARSPLLAVLMLARSPLLSDESERRQRPRENPQARAARGRDG